MTTPTVDSLVADFKTRMPELIPGTSWGSILNPERCAGWLLFLYNGDTQKAIEQAVLTVSHCPNFRIKKWIRVAQILRGLKK